jgi:general secretion pathway protein D
MVTLEVNQEVSAPDFTSVTAANPNPTVSTRNAKTSVVVANGESVALGGLISENNGFSTSGIPLLSKIPVLGALFGSQNLNRTRTELVLVITPKIVSDPVEARQVTNELRERLPALKGMLPPLKDPAAAPAGAPAAPQK